MSTTLLTRIAALAAADPAAPALLSTHARLDRAALWAQSGGVAAALQAAGVSPGDTVGLALPRSVASVVAVIGVLRAGAVYVPVDPAHPLDRQRWILDNAGVRATLVHGAAPDGFPLPIDLGAVAPAAHPLGPADPAGRLNLLYTSGSTGRPKGVIGTLAAMENRVDWAHAALPYAPGEVHAHRSALGFVDAGPELFAPLCAGVPLAVISPAEQADLGLFIAALQSHQVSRITLVPSLFTALLRSAPGLGADLPALRLWILSGEELTLPLLQSARAALPAATFVNLYGTTEVTGDVTAALFRPGDPLPTGRVPLGAPIAGATLAVMDPDGEPVSPGSPGELWVSGPPLAAGYHRSPKEEGARFPLHPRLGRCFRTGDRVCQLPNGEFDFLGRVDNLVKVSGVRIELEEVERTLRQPGAALAVVLSQGRLVAVVEAGDPDAPFAPAPAARAAALQSAAAARLPEGMRPTAHWTVGRLPLSPNGKVDRRAVVAALAAHLRALAPDDAPSTPMEQRLAAIWSNILGRGAPLPIGRQDTFAALGGGSLERAELVLALAPLCPEGPPPAALLREGTLAALAAALAGPAVPAAADPRLTLGPLVDDAEVIHLLVTAAAIPQIFYDTDLPAHLDEEGARRYIARSDGVVIRLDGLAIGAAFVQHDPIVGEGVTAPPGAVQLDEWLLPAYQGRGLLGVEGAWPLLKAWLAQRFRHEVSVVWEDHHAMIRLLESRGYRRLGRSHWRGLPGATPPEGPCEVWLCDLQA